MPDETNQQGQQVGRDQMNAGRDINIHSPPGDSDDQREAAVLQKYLDALFDLMMHKGLQPDNLQVSDVVRKWARTRTLDVLDNVQSPQRKARVLCTLHEHGLIATPNSLVSLSEADLRGISLFRYYLGNADLRGANLEGSDLSETYLDRGNLQATNLRKAYLYSTVLDGCNLKMARLDGSNLSMARLDGTILEFGMLFEARLDGASLREAVLFDARLDRARLDTACLDNARLDGANLDKAILIRATLIGATLERTNLSGVNLSEATYNSQSHLHENGQYLPPTRWPDGFTPPTDAIDVSQGS